MLQLDHVSKEFDMRPVLDDVSFAIEPGLRTLLSAPNGSGKTTLLTIMAGLSKPTRGNVLWGTHAVTAKMRKHIGVLMQQSFLYGDLTATENLRLYATLYDVERVDIIVDEWLENVDLYDVRTERVRDFSKGMRQRLAFARALLHKPALLLLDEPFDGLDVASSHRVDDLLHTELRRGTSVFLVSHQEAEQLRADVSYTLRFGRLVNI